MRSPTAACLVLASMVGLAVPLPAAVREGLHNGDFELGRDRIAERPADWQIGFPDEVPPPGPWSPIPRPAAMLSSCAPKVGRVSS